MIGRRGRGVRGGGADGGGDCGWGGADGGVWMGDALISPPQPWITARTAALLL
jgi:hypothetical protein